MQGKKAGMDFTKLLGFANVQHSGDANIDFKNKTVDARIGAKVGGEACVGPDLREMGVKLPSERKGQTR
jgi:hypothetical protein